MPAGSTALRPKALRSLRECNHQRVRLWCDVVVCRGVDVTVIACIRLGGEALDVVGEKVESFSPSPDPQDLVLRDDRSGVALRVLPERDLGQRPFVGKGVPVLGEIAASSL